MRSSGRGSRRVSGDYLLDTGVANLVALDNPVILQRIAAARRVQVPDIVFGELYFGAYVYVHKHNNTKLLDLYDDFRRRFGAQLLQSDLDTAQIYGAIAAELRVKGQVIQQNDMWIAALARQYGLTLATLDSDFTRVSSLQVDLW